MLCGGAKAAVNSYQFADPTGFNTMTVGSSTHFDFMGSGDLKATLDFLGSEMSLRTSVLDFKTPGTNNPNWMGGSRRMFRLSYGGVAGGGPNELLKLEFEFTKPLATNSYMLFTDFDSEEGLAIAAFDASNNLIPYSAFVFARVDGEMPGGSLLTTPEWRDYNPTLDWQTVDNTGWVGTSAVSGYIVDEIDDSEDDPGVSLQSSIEISRVVFYYNAETDSTGSNSIRFNFASVPEPASMSIFAVLLAGGAIASRRRKKS
jgi:hypothetical protein